jgi:hypothetical protein
MSEASDIALLIRQGRFWFAELEVGANAHNWRDAHYAARNVLSLMEAIVRDIEEMEVKKRESATGRIDS